MGPQGTMALMPPAGAATWTARDLPGVRILAALRAANLAFLELLGGTALAGGAALCGVSAPFCDRLGAPPEARAAVANALPFAMFDLRFRDEQFWRTTTAGSVAVHDAAAAAPVSRAAHAFVRVAVVFTWHAVEVCPPSASLVLGASDGVLRLVGGLPLAALDPLSYRLAPELAARFAQRDLYWERLTQCLGDPEPRRLERLRLLGLQLLGTDSARRQQLQRRGRREP